MRSTYVFWNGMFYSFTILIVLAPNFRLIWEMSLTKELTSCICDSLDTKQELFISTTSLILEVLEMFIFQWKSILLFFSFVKLNFFFCFFLFHKIKFGDISCLYLRWEHKSPKQWVTGPLVSSRHLSSPKSR
mgnify:CR=1 FL=1